MEIFSNYPEVVGITEMQEMLRIGETKARQLLKNGEILYFQVGRSKRIPKQGIVDYITSHLKKDNDMVECNKSSGQTALS